MGVIGADDVLMVVSILLLPTALLLLVLELWWLLLAAVEVPLAKVTAVLEEEIVQRRANAAVRALIFMMKLLELDLIRSKIIIVYGGR